VIRVTVELLPHGIEARKRHLGTMELWNTCEGNSTIANYEATLSKWGRPAEVWRRGRIENFPRARLGPWDVILRLLVQIIGRRNDITPDEPTMQSELWPELTDRPPTPQR
jgi:hypothetical protein